MLTFLSVQHNILELDLKTHEKQIEICNRNWKN